MAIVGTMTYQNCTLISCYTSVNMYYYVHDN